MKHVSRYFILTITFLASFQTAHAADQLITFTCNTSHIFDGIRNIATATPLIVEAAKKAAAVIPFAAAALARLFANRHKDQSRDPSSHHCSTASSRSYDQPKAHSCNSVPLPCAKTQSRHDAKRAKKEAKASRKAEQRAQKVNAKLPPCQHTHVLSKPTIAESIPIKPFIPEDALKPIQKPQQALPKIMHSIADSIKNTEIEKHDTCNEQGFDQYRDANYYSACIQDITGFVSVGTVGLWQEVPQEPWYEQADDVLARGPDCCFVSVSEDFLSTLDLGLDDEMDEGYFPQPEKMPENGCQYIPHQEEWVEQICVPEKIPDMHVGCGDARIKKEAEKAAGLIMLSENNEQAGDKQTVPIKEPTETIESLVKDLVKLPETNGKTTQYIKKGNYDSAEKDFYNLNPLDIRPNPKKKGKLGVLPDTNKVRREVNVREESTYGTPTLEVRDPSTKKKIKIRYVP